MPQSNAPTREQVLAFLNGAGEIDGCGFGDRHPTLPGAFWWRRYLAALSQPSPAVPVDRHGDPERRAFICGWDERGKAHQLHGSETTDRFMNQLLGVYYPRNASPQPTEPAQPATQAGAGHADPIEDFEEGQWWVEELDAMVRSGTNDQKRAVAVVHHLLRAVRATPLPQPSDAPQQGDA